MSAIFLCAVAIHEQVEVRVTLEDNNVIIERHPFLRDLRITSVKSVTLRDRIPPKMIFETTNGQQKVWTFFLYRKNFTHSSHIIVDWLKTHLPDGC